MNTSGKSGLQISGLPRVALNLLLACKPIPAERPKKAWFRWKSTSCPCLQGDAKGHPAQFLRRPLSDNPASADDGPAGPEEPRLRRETHQQRPANATPETLAKITDATKKPPTRASFSCARHQYIQMDLGTPSELFAIVIWHAHNSAKVYHDVIVQVADDAEFTKNVRIIFNNDQGQQLEAGRRHGSRILRTNEGKAD